MFFVAGVTGHVGGAAAHRLIEEGKSVRALVRNVENAARWAQRGVELRQGDLSDAYALASALEGVEVAFLSQSTPAAVSPGFPEAKAINAG